MISGLQNIKTKEEILNPGIIKTEEVITRVTRDFDPNKHGVVILDRPWFEAGDVFETEYGVALELTGKFKRISESETVYTVNTNNGIKGLILQPGHRLIHLYKKKEPEPVVENKPVKTVFYTEESKLQVNDITRPGEIIYCDYDETPKSTNRYNSVLIVSSNIHLDTVSYAKQNVQKFDAIAHVTCEDHIRHLDGKRFDVILLHPTGDFWLWSRCVGIFKSKKLPRLNLESIYLEEELVPSQFFGLDDYLKTKS